MKQQDNTDTFWQNVFEEEYSATNKLILSYS